ncbi:hypothetical protein GCM10009625_27620 [Brachybacterium fresconis]
MTGQFWRPTARPLSDSVTCHMTSCPLSRAAVVRCASTKGSTARNGVDFPGTVPLLDDFLGTVPLLDDFLGTVPLLDDFLGTVPLLDDFLGTVPLLVDGLAATPGRAPRSTVHLLFLRAGPPAG